MNRAEPSAIALRIDPRRPGCFTPAGLWRITLGSAEGSTAPRLEHAEATAKPVRSAGPFARCIAVVVQADRGTLDDHARECIAAAALLANADTEVLAIVCGACRDDPAALGVDTLIHWPGFDPRRFQPETLLQCLVDIDRRHTPERWFMPDRASEGDLGRRFAIATGKSLGCRVAELTSARMRLRAGPGEDWLADHARVMLLERRVADTVLPFVGLGRVGTAIEPPAIDPSGVVDLGLDPGDPRTLALEEADLILAAGNGVTELALFDALASVLGAATGASRVAVDDGRFPRAKQIGATGKTVTASAYLALGISGAVQHLQGIKDCRHVIAVNRDAAAPIVRRAALTLVEDCGLLMQALSTLATAARQEARP